MFKSPSLAYSNMPLYPKEFAALYSFLQQIVITVRNNTAHIVTLRSTVPQKSNQHQTPRVSSNVGSRDIS